MKTQTAMRLKAVLGGAKRVDAALRRETVAFCRAAQEAGDTVAETARLLGMKPNTLQRWNQLARRSKVPKVRKGINFVEIVEPVFEGLDVVWPSGHVVRIGSGDLRVVFSALEATCCPRE
jgi:hypothetical protein